jgi:hypothetical protein
LPAHIRRVNPSGIRALQIGLPSFETAASRPPQDEEADALQDHFCKALLPSS